MRHKSLVSDAHWVLGDVLHVSKMCINKIVKGVT